MQLDRTVPGTKSLLGFRWLVLATCAATYALVVLGGVVRATGSGDACPDWPRCHGELLPPLETDVLIEFSHRLVASLVGLLVLAVAVVAWRWQRRLPLAFWGATAALLLVGAQIVLGGMTVLSDLPSSMVMAHLALAATLLAVLMAVAFASFSGEQVRSAALRDSAAGFRNLALVAAMASFGLMLTGSYVSGTGASLAFEDWPLFDGRLLPEGGRLAMIHVTHRLAAVAVGFLLVYVALRAWRSMRRHRPVLAGSLLALAIYGAEVLVGAANIWTLLQPAATSAHLALAVALWGTLVVVALLAQQAAEVVSPRADAPAAEASLGLARVRSGGLPAGGDS